MLLVYTSSVFLIVHLYGSYLLHWIGPTFFGMAVLSLCNHYTQMTNKGMTWIRRMDTYYAHTLLLATAIEASTLPFSPFLGVYWVCVSWIAYVYRISGRSHCPIYGDYWHASVHISAGIGMCSLLYAISLQRS